MRHSSSKRRYKDHTVILRVIGFVLHVSNDVEVHLNPDKPFVEAVKSEGLLINERREHHEMSARDFHSANFLRA